MFENIYKFMQEKLSQSKYFNTVDYGAVDNYHWKVNIRIAKRLKTYYFRKL